MVFSSLPFLFVYLPLTLAVYYAVPMAWRNLVLFLVSLVFYGWGEPVYILLMLFSITLNYGAGLLVEKYRSQDRKARRIIFWSCAVNLALLVFFKYYDFLAASFTGLTGIRLPILGLGLPIGISFYTFQAMSYPIDVYRVGHRLERIEGYTDWQCQSERGDAYAGNAAERRSKKVKVFEENEQREVDNGIDRQNSSRFFIFKQPVAGDKKSGGIVQHNGKCHQQDVHRLAPAIKHEIYDKEPEIPIPRRNDIVYRQHDRQINKQEQNA